jgi:hypothetical protein
LNSQPLGYEALSLPMSPKDDIRFYLEYVQWFI